MKIIISPAKKMRVETDFLIRETKPLFLEDALRLREKLRSMTEEERKLLWNCSEKLAKESSGDLLREGMEDALTPALLAYDGIQYKYMAPGVFSEQALQYVKEHLRILSGLYGVLRPMDGVLPYRLEMQARLPMENTSNLYEYWGSRILTAFLEEGELLINLASEEYSKAVLPYAKGRNPVITPVFSVFSKGKLRTKATLAKMARGAMVRFLAENGVTDPKGLKDFTELGFRYSAADSKEGSMVFCKEE